MQRLERGEPVKFAAPFRLALSRGALALCAVFNICGAQADSTRFGLDAAYLYDDNATRGPTHADQRSDNVVSLDGHVSRSVLLNRKSGVVARAGVRLAEHAAFGDLSHIALEARGSYRLQPTPGYSQPWLELAASSHWLKHRDSDLRDGFIASATLGAGSHLTDRIRVAAHGSFEKRASHGSVYDLAQNRLWMTLDYRLGPAAVLYASVARVNGDHVFNAVSAEGQAWLAPYYEANAADPALAEEFGGVAPTAYRLDATTLLYELGASLPLRGNQAIDISASWFDAEAERGPGRYDGATLRLGYMYRFR